MKVIIGLGNPGEKYEGTRHNIGFETLDYLLKKYEPVDKSAWEENKKTKSLIKKVVIGKTPTLLAKPQTFMNNSGIAVKALIDFYKLETTDFILIYDELDLPLGKLQIRFGGGTAGHNGVESIISTLGTDKFIRIRMGIGKPIRIDSSKFDKVRNGSSAQYVLQTFGENELPEVKNMVKHVQKNVELLLEHGIETFMSKYHARS